MKRYAKVIIATAIMVSALSSTLYANEVVTKKVVDTEVIENYTFYIKEDSTLWYNKDGQFEKICDNVKSVNTSNFDTYNQIVTILTNDNSLYLYIIENESLILIEENSIDVANCNSYIVASDKSLYKVEFVEDKLISRELIDTDVEDVEVYNCYTMNNNGQLILFLKTDGTLWVYGNDVAGIFGTENKDYTTPKKIVDNVKSFTVNPRDGFVYISDDGNAYGVYKDMYTYGAYDNSDLADKSGTLENPLLIATDVKRVVFNDIAQMFVIKNDNTLFSNNSISVELFNEDTRSYEEKHLIKLADNVVDVASAYSHTTFVTEDGELFGFGENKQQQLGNAKNEYLENFDKNGFRVIATDVKTASIGNSITSVIKNDDSLYTLGESIEGESVIEKTQNGENKLTKIADDVSYVYTNFGILYVQGEDKELYSMGEYFDYSEEQAEIINDFYTTYRLDYFGIEYDSLEEVKENSEKYDKLIQEKMEAMPYEEMNELYENIEKGINKIVSGFEKYPIAENVRKATYGYYVTEENELFKIGDDFASKAYLKNVKDIASEMYSENFLMIGTDDSLYNVITVDKYEFTFDFDADDYTEHVNMDGLEYADMMSTGKSYDDNGFISGDLTVGFNKETPDVKALGIDNVRSVAQNYWAAYIVKNDNTLWALNQEHYIFAFVDNDGNYSGWGFDEKGRIKDLKDVVKDRSVLSETNIVSENANKSEPYLSYVDKDNIEIHYFTAEGEQIYNIPVYKKDDLYEINNEYYILEKIADNVQSVSFGDGVNVYYVDMNGVLYGKGDNSLNQLGIQDEDYYNDFIKIMDDVKMVTNNDGSTIVVKTDGTLVGMGVNRNGELGFKGVGDLNPFRINSPVKVNVK